MSENSNEIGFSLAHSTEHLLKILPRIAISDAWTMRFSQAIKESHNSVVSAPLESSVLMFDLWRPDQLIALALSDMGGPISSLYIDAFSRNDSPYSPSLTKQQEHQIKALVYSNSRFAHSGLMIATTTNWTNINSLLHQQVDHYITGVGYDSSTVTVQISLAVIMLYCVVILVHLLTTLISRETSNSWDSISELVLLALNSKRPGHIGCTSAGTETMNTYRKGVNVRVNDERSLELIFTEEAGEDGVAEGRVEANTAY